MKKSETKDGELHIAALKTGRLVCCLLGTKPLIYNSVSLKSKQSLLIPSAKKTTVERAGSLKHEPFEEYVASTYHYRDDAHATRLFAPARMFKGALKSAALRMPGLKKTEIAQLVWCDPDEVNVFGIPQIYLDVVRSADINRTPDIRTRAILPQWCAAISVDYVKPQLSDKAIVNLVAAAGMLCGIGDGRQEKGYGYGTFEIVGESDERFLNLVQHGTREQQDAALKNPTPYNVESEELLSIFETEVDRRGDAIVRVKAA